MKPHFLKSQGAVENFGDISLIRKGLFEHRNVFGGNRFGLFGFAFGDLFFEQIDALLDFILGIGILGWNDCQNVLIDIQRIAE